MTEMHTVPIGLKMKNIPLAAVSITTTCALEVQALALIPPYMQSCIFL